ncbi:hypothetical protein IV487_13185 [Enterococcus saccharolyticus]|uniref:hypothetical protein n=1 Tax=Enterococcus saccharolyticus TaxID=41997 RepID=UPI001E59CFCE|nr:hypothetical protein [Enterococcus saccharolyticus]MCD5003417.1 hypothetical protein [Enterococcus saccharolyticus]
MKVLTICGSMRYAKEMIQIATELELRKGYAVIQCVYPSEGMCQETDFAKLDQIHKKKIAISDGIYVVNIDGYIGTSTRNEIAYALENGKEVLYHEKMDDLH